MTEKLQ